jgi:tRNA (adenine57-N1/adenine58-N1)-methyltransferase
LLIAIKENDVVLLRKKQDPSSNPILTKPLNPTTKINTSRGSITHADIIGKGVRDVVAASKGALYRIHQPSLAEYVTLSPRIVTPVSRILSWLAELNFSSGSLVDISRRRQSDSIFT